MGQAKQRGTFEQRKAAAILRNKEDAKVKKPVYKVKNWFVNLLATLGAGSCIR